MSNYEYTDPNTLLLKLEEEIGSQLGNVIEINKKYNRIYMNDKFIKNIFTKNELRSILPIIKNAGIHDAEYGIIQDPAGSAIGKNTLSGSGASGAIYDKFTDLHCIPNIPPCASIMNSKEGSRVMHTFSPILSGDPTYITDVINSLKKLISSYYSAILLFSNLPECNKVPLNLVPLAGGIFANSFLRYDIDHLDPSYTIVSIILAIYLLKLEGKINKDIPLTLYIYKDNVYDITIEYIKELLNKF